MPNTCVLHVRPLPSPTCLSHCASFAIINISVLYHRQHVCLLQSPTWTLVGAYENTTRSAIEWRMECRDQEVPNDEGTDLTSVSTADRPACKEQCRVTPNCNAFSRNRNDGMCYMKQGFDMAAVTVWNSATDFDFCYEGGTIHIHRVLTGSVWLKATSAS